MKNYIKIFFGVCILLSTGCNKRQPAIKFRTNEISFTVKEGQKSYLTYFFKNTGTDSLKIINAKADCGCTEVKYQTTAIPPNAEGVIKVTFNSNYGALGPFTRAVLIESNTKPILHTLYLKGVVVKS